MEHPVPSKKPPNHETNYPAAMNMSGHKPNPLPMRLRCENCGGVYLLPSLEGFSVVRCQYCGTLLVVPSTLSQSSTTQGGGVEKGQGLEKGENVVLDEAKVRYHSGHSKIPGPLWGRLLLSNKRLVFLEQRLTERRWFLFKVKKTDALGIRLNILLEKIVGATTDARQRKRGTVSETPSIFDKEDYNVIVVSVETGDGVENPTFEVAKAQEWLSRIRSNAAGVLLVGT